MSARRYKMLADGGKGRIQVKTGDTVFECVKYDYGCANDDTRTTGVEHRSYTLNQNGDYPFFTVPVSDVEEIK